MSSAPAKVSLSTRDIARARRWLYAALAVAVVACGPELTTPSSTLVSGEWVSADTAGGVTDFRLTLSQAPDGVVTGAWSGRGLEVNGACPPALSCAPSAAVMGTHTVFQLHIDLKGLGAFSGQVLTDTQFRGHLDGFALTFHRPSASNGTLTGTLP